jgi:hypothetical protein
MSTLTTVIFLLDVLSYKDELKKNLNNIQLSKIETLINVFYQKLKENFQIDEEQYLQLYKLYKSRRINEINKKRQDALKITVENIKYFLETACERKELPNKENDEIINYCNCAYNFIIKTLKESIKNILEEEIQEKDVEKLKFDNSKNAHIQMAKQFILSKKSKEEFTTKHFITQERLNRSLQYVLNLDDDNLNELKNSIIQSELELEEEVFLAEQLLFQYNRKEKNIKLIEFQALTKLTLPGMLKELGKRKSYAYDKCKDFYYEYQNRYCLQPIYYEQARNTKTTINGRVMTAEDHDIIEKFIKDNNYPEQREIYATVKAAYFKGNIDTLQRDKLKRSVLEKFNLVEKEPTKYYK